MFFFKARNESYQMTYEVKTVKIIYLHGVDIRYPMMIEISKS